MTTPFMGLTLPTPTVTPGPTYATENNAALTTIDAHTHGPGSGVAVPANGLNINGPVSWNGNSLTSATLVSFVPGSTSTRAALYFSGVDLYVNDASGNVIQVTQSGGLAVAAATRGFGGDYGVTGTGAAVYSNTSKTFTFTQASNQAALMDVGELLVRKTTATSQPAAHVVSPTLSSDSYLTLPGSGIHIQLPTALPLSGSAIVTLDSSGNLSSGAAVSGTGGKAFVVVDSSGVPSTAPASAPSAQAMMTIDNAGTISNIQPDGSTLEIASATTLRVKALGVTNSQIANGTIVGSGTGTTKFVAATIGTADIADSAITPGKMAARPIGTATVTNKNIGSADGNYLFATISSFVFTGRPVVICIVPGNNSSDAYLQSRTTFSGGQATTGGTMQFSDSGSGVIATIEFKTMISNPSGYSNWNQFAPGQFHTVWVSPSAGTRNITLNIQVADIYCNIMTSNLVFVAYEL